MVMHERVIKFPVPDWNRVTNHELDSIACCICYQYDFNGSNHGPYGFKTNLSSKIINDTFPGLFFYKKCSSSGKEILTSVAEIKERGVYFYGDDEKIKLLKIELDKYYLSKKKNEMRLRKSLDVEPLPPKPLLSGLSSGKNYESRVIREIIGAGYGMFISNYYMPEAGDSLILFDSNVVSSFKKNALRYGVGFSEVNSIDDLKPW